MEVVLPATDLASLPVAERDQRIAETLAFMVQRGYDITSPGEAATIVRKVDIANDTNAGAFYVQLADQRVKHTVAYADNVKLDLDADGSVIGIKLTYGKTPRPVSAWRRLLRRPR